MKNLDCYYYSIDHFFSELPVDGAVNCKINLIKDIYLDVCVDIRNTDIIVFVFSGAASKGYKPPYYSASSLKKDSQASFIQISDPCLYFPDEVRLGWYMGSENINLSEIIQRLISCYLTALNSKRSIFFGGSGGGFASLYYSRLIDNSLALVWNPQTNIEAYDVSDFRVRDKYASVCFGLNSGEELSSVIAPDLKTLYQEGYNNNVIYMQNLTDKHFKRDCMPFFEGLGVKIINKEFSNKVSPGIYLHLTNWSLGHKPPPKIALQRLLSRLSKPELDWNFNVFKKTLMRAEQDVLESNDNDQESSFSTSVVHFDDNTCIKHLDNSSDTLFVTFEGIQKERSRSKMYDKKGYAQDFVLNAGFSLLSVNRREYNYYQDLDRSFFYKKTKGVINNYKKIYFYGSSGGGYAALYYSTLFDANVIAISPKIRIDRLPLGKKNKEMKHSFMSDLSSTNKVYAIYDPYHGSDKLFLERRVAPCFSNLCRMEIAHQGHGAFYLAEVKALKEVVLGIVEKGEFPKIDSSLRKKSIVYLYHYARYLFKKKKRVKLAKIVCDYALKNATSTSNKYTLEDIEKLIAIMDE